MLVKHLRSMMNLYNATRYLVSPVNNRVTLLEEYLEGRSNNSFVYFSDFKVWLMEHHQFASIAEKETHINALFPDNVAEHGGDNSDVIFVIFKHEDDSLEAIEGMVTSKKTEDAIEARSGISVSDLKALVKLYEASKWTANNNRINWLKDFLSDKPNDSYFSFSNFKQWLLNFRSAELRSDEEISETERPEYVDFLFSKFQTGHTSTIVFQVFQYFESALQAIKLSAQEKLIDLDEAESAAASAAASLGEAALVVPGQASRSGHTRIRSQQILMAGVQPVHVSSSKPVSASLSKATMFGGVQPAQTAEKPSAAASAPAPAPAPDLDRKNSFSK